MFADFAPAPGSTKRDPAVSQVPEDIHWSRVAIHFAYLLAQNLGLGHCAVNQSRRAPGRHAEKPFSQLFQTLVPVLPRLGEYALHQGAEPGSPQ